MLVSNTNGLEVFSPLETLGGSFDEFMTIGFGLDIVHAAPNPGLKTFNQFELPERGFEALIGFVEFDVSSERVGF